MSLVYKDLAYNVIGACFEVHKELGCGFLEPVYQEALRREFDLRNISYEKEKRINIQYKGQSLDKYYQADFICDSSVLIELKALTSLDSTHEAQVINYLKATSLKLGLLINFGDKSLKYKRIVL